MCKLPAGIYVNSDKCPQVMSHESVSLGAEVDKFEIEKKIFGGLE